MRLLTSPPAWWEQPRLPACGLLGSQPVQKGSAGSWGCLQGLPISRPLDTALLSKSRRSSSCVAHGSPMWAVCHRPGSGGPWARRKGESLELGCPRPCGEGGNFSSNHSPMADSVMQDLSARSPPATSPSASSPACLFCLIHCPREGKVFIEPKQMLLVMLYIL